MILRTDNPARCILARAAMLLPASILATLAAGAPGAPVRDARPNIVFILADDHAWQAISAYGDERHLIQTPHIDRIAREGMRFDRCYVANPLCGPSRATFLTGTYSHINGFYNNTGSRFDGSQPTFPQLLRNAGYQTGLVGKWHLVTDPTGFDYWEIFRGQGDYYQPRMIRNGTPVVHEGYATDLVTDLSLAWLRKRDPNRPFLLLAWEKAPHRPWEPAVRDLGRDHDREYPLPPTLFDDLSGRGPAERHADMSIATSMELRRDNKLAAEERLTPEQRAGWDAYYEPRNAEFKARNLSGDDLTRWKYQRFLHDYLACVRGIDDNVGRILRYLDENGLADNTVVVYASDQGFFLGEHGWFDKRWIFQESVRTPLLVRWPKAAAPGGVSDRIVSNIDIAQTLLDAAGVPAPARMQGRSLVPLLRGENPSDWRRAFYFHYYEFPAWCRVAPHYGLVTERYTLAHFQTPATRPPAMDHWELFDRARDPRELASVYDRPEYREIQRQLREELARLRMQLHEPEQDDPAAFGMKQQFEP